MALKKLLYQIDLRIVLVRPLYDRNVGAASRAMTNMGISKLILIAPQCDITFAAQQAAARGQEPLREVQIYQNWEDFFKSEPEGIRISFTARDGRARQIHDTEYVYTKITQSELFLKSVKKAIPIYFFFGPEDCGLSDQDLNLTHFSTYLPTYGKNLSLNLAQAVLLAMFSFRHFINSIPAPASTIFLERHQTKSVQKNAKVFSKDQKPSLKKGGFPEEVLKTWLTELGFNLSHHRINAFTVLKRLLLHSIPTEKELRILEVVLQQNIRKLRNR